MNSGGLLLTLIVALIVFGPQKLPMLATHLGVLFRTVNRLKQQGLQWWQQQQQLLTLQENERKAQEADEHYQRLSRNTKSNNL